MKKTTLINLIKYHMDNNEVGFFKEAVNVAKEFDENGDTELAQYIMAVISRASTFSPQALKNEIKLPEYLKKISTATVSLPLPETISQDIIGIINAIQKNIGVHKFLFKGPPGTGKTESVKHIARLLNRELYGVDFSYLVDSKLGQTPKNIVSLFNEINGSPQPERLVILFDEIDALALDRTNKQDLREMGRVTSTVLKCLDELSSDVVLISTTNLFEHLDRALVRRFDSVIDFNRYTDDDLVEIAESIVSGYLNHFRELSKDNRLLRKIIRSAQPIPYPGELKNIIKSSIAFSDPGDPKNYLKRIYWSLHPDNKNFEDLSSLQSQGFTLRETEILTGISKSQVARNLKIKH